MPDSLQDVYNWMQAYLCCDIEPTPEEMAHVVLPTLHMQASEGLALQRRQYWIKLVGLLRLDFPNLERFLGAETFQRLAEAYLKPGPLRSINLRTLKHGVPAFLETAADVPHRDFSVDLACLEVAGGEVSTELYQHPVTKDMLADRPWQDQRLVPILAHRVLALHYPVFEYTQQHRTTGADPWLKPQPNWLLVLRRALQLRRVPLTEDEHTLMGRLHGGQPLRQAGQGFDPAWARQRAEAWIEERLYVACLPADAGYNTMHA